MTYDSLNAPKEKPLWAVAYSINDDTEHHRLYKVGTNTRRASGRVSKWARKYADSYEEAVELFNSLVQKRINNLLEMVEDAKKDFIE